MDLESDELNVRVRRVFAIIDGGGDTIPGSAVLELVDAGGERAFFWKPRPPDIPA